MNLAFSICNTKENYIRILDLTQVGDDYIPEDLEMNKYSPFRYFNYRYSETVTINSIFYHSSEEESLLQTVFTKHDVKLDAIDIKLNKDGYYRVVHIVLPTILWLNDAINNPKFDLNTYTNIYVSDGDKVYKYINLELQECDVLEIININSYLTTISRCEKNFFCTWKTFKCYINLCKIIFDANKTKCVKNFNYADDIIFKRDFVWMTLNIIKYHIELNQLAEALILLEQLNYCNGFCSNYLEDINNNNSSSCNCNG